MSMGFKQVGGLWITKKEGKDTYLKGKVQETVPAGTAIFVFKNTRKKNTEEDSRKPDYVLNMAVDDDAGGPIDQSRQQELPPRPPAAPPAEDSIPW
jgi:hypothetical protein